ncbi:GNAT family N-acetyltransferase [Shouchella patagoniensis]|uniref:GNAT family N-acetyltransferase n=1 Tax=Shouchella patagoniensis TaxID=228576 RepID=UPI000995D847|nr:GNAT family N-acetyltransferase [Shouchella patagoniensis]
MNGKNISIRFVEVKRFTYCSSKEIAETTSIPHPYPDGGAEFWFEQVTKEKKEGGVYTFSIFGIVSVKKKGNRIRAIDYWLNWNKGIATIAIRKAIHFSFHKLGLKIIKSDCLSSNIGSRKVLEKRMGLSFLKRKFIIDLLMGVGKIKLSR